METNNTQETQKLHWGIKILLFIGGNFAAGFILSFSALLFRDSTVLYSLLGAALLVANVLISKKCDERMIYAICIPAYIYGSAMFLVGLLIKSVPINCLLEIIIAAITYFFIENRFLKNLLILKVFAALPALLVDWNWNHSQFDNLCVVGFIYIMIYLLTCFLEESINKEKFLREALSAVRFSAFLCGIVLVFFNDNTIMKRLWLEYEAHINVIYMLDWLSILYGISAIAVAVYLIYEYFGRFEIIPILISIVIIALSTFYRPVVMSLLCIMLGFWTKDRRIWILSIVYAIGCTTFFYYNTTYTLLSKSLGLMAIGAAVLLVSLYLFKQGKQIENKKELSHE